MWKEFRAFIVRGNVVDLTVGFIVGAAFTAVVRSMVTNLFMPPLGLLVGEVDFSERFLLLSPGDPAPPYATVGEAQAAGAVTLNYGVFMDEVLSFLLIGFVVFLVVRSVESLERRRQNAEPGAPVTKECPFCVSAIPVRARRCPSCTSQIPEAA